MAAPWTKLSADVVIDNERHVKRTIAVRNNVATVSVLGHAPHVIKEGVIAVRQSTPTEHFVEFQDGTSWQVQYNPDARKSGCGCGG